MIESGKCKSMDDISDCNSANMELSQTPYGIGKNFALFHPLDSRNTKKVKTKKPKTEMLSFYKQNRILVKLFQKKPK